MSKYSVEIKPHEGASLFIKYVVDLKKDNVMIQRFYCDDIRSATRKKNKLVKELSKCKEYPIS